MKIFLTFILLLSLNIYGDDSFDENFEDSFEDQFEQELVSESAKNEIYDPLMPYNRFMTNVNDTLMIYIVEPVTTGYKFVIPKVARKSVNNVLTNLYYPVSVTNNLLQLKFKHSLNETIRFITNSTLGILGLFDVADSWFGIKPHREDFGQTLGYYGIGPGFPIVLPFFGQQNLRDLLGGVADSYADPAYHVSAEIEDDMVSFATYLTIKGYKDINEYSLEDVSYEDLTKDAIDLYPFIRDAYEQRRNKLIEE